MVRLCGVGWAIGRVSDALVFGALPLTLVGLFTLGAIGDHFAFDFQQFWQGARDVLDGHSPYATHEALAAVRDLPPLDPFESQEVFRFTYPAPAAVALLPFAALPFPVAAGLFTALLVACVPAALLVLGVRDWRCHGAALGSVAVLGAIRLGTFTPLFVLGLAVLWRYRDRRWIAAAAVVPLVTAKLFLWPLLVWLLATRRISGAIAAALGSLATIVLAWAAIGFDGFRVYPELLETLAANVQEKSLSAVALGMSLGLAPRTAQVGAMALGAVVLGAVVLAGRRPGGDRAAFVFAVGAALLLTPLVWLHYLALLIVPIALARPRLAPLWLVPLALWISPYQESGAEAWRIVLALGVTLLVVLASAGDFWRLRERLPVLGAPARGRA